MQSLRILPISHIYQFIFTHADGTNWVSKAIIHVCLCVCDFVCQFVCPHNNSKTSVTHRHKHHFVSIKNMLKHALHGLINASVILTVDCVFRALEKFLLMS